MACKNTKSVPGQITLAELLDIVGGSSSDEIGAMIEQLREAKEQARKREAEERRRREMVDILRQRQEERERREAHVREVTCMDLPLDWENVFDTDERTRSVHTDSIPDALVMCLNILGRVDIDYISSVTGADYKTVICTLKGSIYQNTDTWDECFYKGWETAEEYLSGNLMRKLNTAREAYKEYYGWFSENIKAIESKPPVKRVVCTGPKRAWYRRATEVPLNDPPTALFSRAAAKAAVLFCLSYFVTRKRVYVFVKTYLVTSYILLQLVSYVFFNDFFISANCINIVSSAPKMAISILVFQICVSVKYHQTALSFQVSHKLRYPTEFYAASLSCNVISDFHYPMITEGRERIEQIYSKLNEALKNGDDLTYDEQCRLENKRMLCETLLECFDREITFIYAGKSDSGSVKFIPENRNIKMYL